MTEKLNILRRLVQTMNLFTGCLSCDVIHFSISFLGSLDQMKNQMKMKINGLAYCAKLFRLWLYNSLLVEVIGGTKSCINFFKIFRRARKSNFLERSEFISTRLWCNGLSLANLSLTNPLKPTAMIFTLIRNIICCWIGSKNTNMVSSLIQLK